MFPLKTCLLETRGSMKSLIIFLLCIALSESSKPKIEIYEIRENTGNDQIYMNDRYIHNDKDKETQLSKLQRPYKKTKHDNSIDKVTKELIKKLQAMRSDNFNKNIVYVLNDDILIDDHNYNDDDYVNLNNNEGFIDKTRSNKYGIMTNYDKDNFVYRI
ncbi:uncharacterized protein LOC116412992 [Galleria mellonella]|uniref:Uncharacterized protein LOC116412992 n=1 Tax=Galleria mellonella TaxID=7137 RepID=A0ABM3MGA8_GALME|nr:uncharacterized protein LOC116412992 [Galleria mellonella]